MDLNKLYCMQQRALMRAAAAGDLHTRQRHQIAADRCTGRIERFQRDIGAGISALRQRAS
jgi:hypothetical protein